MELPRTESSISNRTQLMRGLHMEKMMKKNKVLLQLTLLNINKIYLYNIALFMFKFENGFLPNIFNNLFCQNISKYNYFTTQRNMLIISKT